jgi:hypothetical protein
VLAVAALHLLLSSNTGAASIIVPILVALATDLHLDSMSDMAKAGILMTVCGRRVRGVHAVGGCHARGRVSPLICVRCMIRRAEASKASRRCMTDRLSHSTRSPTRHL